MAAADDGKIPVTVLTGFLGSGKTTLLNHILTQTHGKKLAIIENEFGAVGVDDDLIKQNTKTAIDEEVIEMMNGCICCTVRQDLIVVLKKLAARHKRGNKIEGVIIETTGLADPAPVAQTFFVDDEVGANFRLDGIVTLIDAKHIEQHLDEEKPEGVENEAVEQVAFADRILLNKTDLVEPADLKRVELRLHGINAFAPVFQTCQSRISVDSVLNVRGFDLDRTLKMDPEFLDTEAEHEHDDRVTSVSITEDGNVDLDLVQAWIGTTLREKGADIFRMKGILSINNAESKFIYQAVHMIFTGEFDEKWGDEKRTNKLVFIGKNLDHEEIKASFKACLDSPEVQAAKVAALRFKIGDAVECNTAEGWLRGNVVAVMYRDDHMPPGVVAPYQVQLVGTPTDPTGKGKGKGPAVDSDMVGDLIYAPMDEEELIRAAK